MVNLNWLQKVAADFTPGAVGIWLLVLGIFGWWVQQLRADRKLSLEDRMAAREGFTKDVARLAEDLHAARAEIGRLAEQARADREEHQEYRRLCIVETDQLRSEIFRLRGLVEMERGKVQMLVQLLARFRQDADIEAALLRLDAPLGDQD